MGIIVHDSAVVYWDSDVLSLIEALSSRSSNEDESVIITTKPFLGKTKTISITGGAIGSIYREKEALETM
jgi:hypothetical protein